MSVLAAISDSNRQADVFMQSADARKSVSPVAPGSKSYVPKKPEIRSTTPPPGEVDMEPRFAELETHLKYIRRDLEEVRGDVKSIRHRLAYTAGATVVVLGLLGWVGNSRFDQLVTLLG